MKDSPDVVLHDLTSNEVEGFVPLIAFVGKHSKHSTMQMKLLFYPAFDSSALTDDVLESLISQFRSGLQQHRLRCFAEMESQGRVS